MSVLERTREIGVLRALGASRWRIRRTMANESLLISLAGTVAGVAAGLLVGEAPRRADAEAGTGYLARFVPTSGPGSASAAWTTSTSQRAARTMRPLIEP